MFYLLRSIKNFILLSFFRTKWKNRNKHNDTFANTIFPIDKVFVGNYTYGLLNIYSYRNPNEHLSIGSFCSIASDVLFILSGEHSINRLSTFPFGEKIFNDKRYVADCKGPIILEDDVWIGVRTTILSGVKIGQGSIIGANSIVFKDIPPYSIYVGNRVIRSRFEQSVAKKLKTIDFSSFTKQDIYRYKEILDCPITDENVDEILNMFPRKLEEY